MCNWNIEIGQIQLAIAKRLKVIDYLELRQVIVDVIEQARSKESDREKVELIRQMLNRSFQTKYKTYFSVHRMSNQDKPKYFSVFEKVLLAYINGQNVSFEFVLRQMAEKKMSKNYISYATKLLAMIDHRFPIWDSFVKKHTGIKFSTACRTDIHQCCEQYKKLICFMKENSNSKNISDYFERVFGSEIAGQIHLQKKIDFCIWWNR